MGVSDIKKRLKEQGYSGDVGRASEHYGLDTLTSDGKYRGSSSYQKIKDRVKNEGVRTDSFGVDQKYIDSFINDANSYISSAQNDYNAMEWKTSSSVSSSRADSYSDLYNRGQRVLAYVKANKGNLDKEDYDSFISSMESTMDALYGINNTFAEKAGVYAKFKSEEDYNNAVANQKDIEEKTFKYDLEAGGKEIESWESILSEAQGYESDILDRKTYLATGTSNSGVENYNGKILDEYKTFMGDLYGKLQRGEIDEETYNRFKNNNYYKYGLQNQDSKYVKQNELEDYIQWTIDTKEGNLNNLLAPTGYGNVYDLEKGVKEKKLYHQDAERLQYLDHTKWWAESAKDFELVTSGASVIGQKDLADKVLSAKQTAIEASKTAAYNSNRPNNTELKTESVNAKNKYDTLLVEYESLYGSIDNEHYLRYMEEDELKAYTYYIKQGDTETANAYLDRLKDDLTQREGREIYEQMNDNIISEILFRGGAGIEQHFTGIGNYIGGLFGLDPDPTSATQYASQLIDEDLADIDLKWYNFKTNEWNDKDIFGKSLGQVLGDVAYTTGNQLPSIIVGSVTGGVGGAISMGISAAGNGYADFLKEGYSKEQAMAYGTMSGLLETTLSYAISGITSLGGKVSGGLVNHIANKFDSAFARVAIKIGGNMISEGLEESLQEILDPWLKTLATGEFNWESPTIDEVLYAGLLGALSAGMLEGTGTIVEAVKTKNAGKAVQNAGMVDRLVKVGSTFSADSVAYKIASKVNENTGAYTIGRLLNEVNATLTQQNVSDIVFALESKGVSSKDANTIAQYIGMVVEGQALTEKQASILENNDVVSEVVLDVIINQNSTVNQRMMGYAEVMSAVKNGGTNAMAGVDSVLIEESKPESTKAPQSVDSSTETKMPTTAEILSLSDGKTRLIADNSEVTVKGVDSIKDGEVFVRLDNGEVVNKNDVHFGSGAEGLVYEAVANMDVSSDTANTIVQGFNPNGNISATDYIVGVRDAYAMGHAGLPFVELARSEKVNFLPEEVRQKAYIQGRDNATVIKKQAQVAFKETMAKAEEAKKAGKNKKATVESTDSVRFHEMDESTLTGRRKASVDFVKRIAKVFSKSKFVFFASYKDANGKRVYKDADGKIKSAPSGKFLASNGEIWIDINAGNLGNGLILFTASHELTHFAKQFNPEQYQAFVDFLMEQYGNLTINGKKVSVDLLVSRQIAKAARNGRKISYEEALDEVVADSCERFLLDGNAIHKLEANVKDKGLIAQIKSFIRNLISNVKRWYAGLNPDSLEANLVSKMDKKTIQELIAMWENMLEGAGENYEVLNQFSTDNMRGNAEGAVVKSEVTDALMDSIAKGDVLLSERTEYEALPKQTMSLSTGAGTILYAIEGLTPTKVKGLTDKGINGYTGRDVRMFAMKNNGFTKAQIDEVNKFMDSMSDFMKEAGITYRFIGLQDVENAQLHYTYNPDGSIKSIVLSAMVKNGDYPVNFDLSSICKKRDAMSKLINKLANRGTIDNGTVKLTPTNIFKINTALKDAGYETACLGCFVESKRYNSLEWAKKFCDKWNAAVKKVNPNATYFGYGNATFNEDSFTVEQAIKIDEAANKYIKATKTERLANALAKYKAKEQAGQPLVAGKVMMVDGKELYTFPKAARDRIMKSDTISEELKTKYLTCDVSTLNMADVEFLLENGILSGANLSNKQAVTEMVKSGEAYQHLLRPSDLLTDRGISKLEALPNFHGVLYGHYGSGTPKLMQSYTPYNSEIALLPTHKNNEQTLAEYLYTIAGVRMQSFSDFQIQNIYDYLQMVADLAARKVPAHAYTKEISFAKLLGMTGIKVNLSVMFDIDPMVDKAHAGLIKLNPLIHKGEYAKVVLEDAQGKWVYNIGDYQTQKMFQEAFPDEAKRFLQSIGFADAVKLQSSIGYSSNCGIIGVGYSDLGIFAMLDDNRVRYIIPYHASSLPADIKVATNIELGTDYTPYQNNMKIEGIVDRNGNKVNWTIKEAYKRLGSGQAVINELNNKVRNEGWVVTTKKAQTGHGTYGLYEDLQQTGDPRQTASNFMDWCIGNNTLPLFYQFASHNNYYKLLYDYNVYDCVTEEYAPQQAVTNTYPTMVDGQVQPSNVSDGGFNTEFLQEIIDKQMAFMDEYGRNLDADLDKLADNMEKGNYSLQESLKDKFYLSDRDSDYLDAVYLDAVNRGDMKTAQAMVDEAAKRAGYAVNAFHGTNAFGFTEVDTSKSDDGISFFATDSIETASSYSGVEKVKRLESSSSQMTEDDLAELENSIKRLSSDLVEFCNRSVGIHNWANYDHLYDELDECFREMSFNAPFDSIKDHLWAACDDLYYSLNDAVFDYSGYETYEAYEESEEAVNLAEDFYAYVDQITNKLEALDYTGNSGIYDLYVNTDKHLVVDCGGKYWNRIKSENLPDFDSEKYGYRGYWDSWTTRSVAKYAKDLGYSGVTFKNIIDSGDGRHILPATVYIFFNPQAQVKSADPVTYDDDGNIIPLSQRFNSKKKDIRYSDRDNAPTFYSQMGKVVEGMKQEKFAANSIIPMLRGRGVKAEEIRWSGIATWLEGKKSVTKQELMDFINGSMLQIGEEILSDKEIPYSKKEQEKISKYETERDVIAENLKSEWKRIVGTDIPITYFGAGLESVVVNELTKANANKKGETEDGYKYKAAMAALQRCVEYSDNYFGYDNERQAFREAVRNPIGFINSNELTSFEKGVFRDFIKAKEAYSKVEGIPVQEQKSLLGIAASADRISSRISKVKSDHLSMQAKHLTKWGQYKLKGGTNYRELLFNVGDSDYYNEAMATHWDERDGILAHARIQDFVYDFSGYKMLFIEEIQSDWHNEGKKNGYEDESLPDFTLGEYQTQSNGYDIAEVYDWNKNTVAFIVKLKNSFHVDLSNGEYFGSFKTEQEALYKLKRRDHSNVPDAPFRDNYHEYVLKRLLRMAAEEGYDSLGWTTADIQSKRWSDEYAEGYRIEYDQDIPKFLKKYGRQWGAKVDKTKAPNGEEVWSMELTDSMKDSVLHEGQTLYSLREVDPVMPTSDKWQRTSTTQQVKARFPKLWDVTADESEVRNPTQISGTVKSYRKVYDHLKEEGFNGTILDASSGLGYGTRAGIKEYGFKVEDIEPYPDKSYKPKYTDYSKLNKKYDVIISNAVLNVIPQDQRDALVVKMGELLKDGGRMFINVRGDDVKNASSKVAINEGLMEYYISQSGSYQKGFTKSELVAYLQDALGEGFTVEPISWFGKTSAIVTKNEGQVLYQDRDSDSMSNRYLLANALETTVQNDIEKNKLAEYKQKIDLIESEERRLSEIRDQLFGKTEMVSEKTRKELQFEMKQVSNRINTYDKQLLNLESTSALKKVLEREKRMAYKRAEQKGRDAVAKQRERNAETVRTLMNKYQQQRKDAVNRVRETRDKNDAKETLQKLVLQTAKWISYPAKDDVKCPDILRQPYADFLKSIDLSSKRKLEGGEATKNDLRMASAMDSLATAIEKIKVAQDPSITTDNILDSGYLDLPAEFVEKLREMAESVKGMMVEGDHIVNQMSSGDIRALSKLIRTLNHAIKEMSTLYNNLRFARVEELGDNSMTFMDSMGEAKGTNGVGDFIGWDNALPYYAFQRFGEGGESVFEELMDAQDQLAYHAKTIFEFKDKNWTDKEADGWSKDTHTVELTNGKTATGTTADFMGIYCLSRREQAVPHLLGGGIRIIGGKKGTKQAQDSRTNLTEEDIKIIVNSLSERQIKVANAIQEFMSTVCSDWGNEISMKRFLTEEFTEKFYYPIESNDENLAQKDPQAKQSDLYRLLNISATKPTVKGANNEVIIRNIFDVFTNHASDMARLNAYGMALLDYMKWLNYREKIDNADGSFKVRGVVKSMGNTYGDKAKSYVVNLIKDINGRSSDGKDHPWLMEMTRMAKTAAVGGSLRVAMLQVTAYPRAAMVLSMGSLAKGLTKVPSIRKAQKYCGIALWKSFGFYDTNIARSIEDQIRGAKNIRQKIIELSLKGAEWADAVTWGALWNACEYEVAKTSRNKVGSEEFYQEVGKKLREVVYATQVVDSTLTRTQIMRSKSGLTQTATAFMSEPSLTHNILMNAAFQFHKEKRISGSAKVAWKKTGKLITKTISVYSSTALLVAIMESLADAYRDDDDEEFIEKFKEAFTENSISNIVPFNNIPIISDIANLILSQFDIGYFSSDRLDTTWLTQANDAIRAWKEVIAEWSGEKETSKTPYNAIYNTVRALSSVTGLPIANLMREVVTLWNNTAGEYDPTLKIKMYESTDEELRKLLYEAITEEKGGDRIQNIKDSFGFEDDDAYERALKTALRENDPRIHEAGQAYYEGDLRTYEQIVNEIAGEGYFDEEIVVGAVRSEVSAIKKEEEGETSEESSTPKADEVTSIYKANDINTAFESGDTAYAKEIIADLVETKKANGMTEKEAKSSLRSSLTSYWKPLYKQAYQNKDTEEMKRIRYILRDSGLYGTTSDVMETVKNWLKDN